MRNVLDNESMLCRDVPDPKKNSDRTGYTHFCIGSGRIIYKSECIRTDRINTNDFLTSDPKNTKRIRKNTLGSEKIQYKKMIYKIKYKMKMYFIPKPIGVEMKKND